MKRKKNPFRIKPVDLTPPPGPKRLAKMRAVPSGPVDTRECGWLGCGNTICEPFCEGVPRS